jgi:hypothetical protein
VNLQRAFFFAKGETNTIEHIDSMIKIEEILTQPLLKLKKETLSHGNSRQRVVKVVQRI